jgi:hypothetical protein
MPEGLGEKAGPLPVLLLVGRLIGYSNHSKSCCGLLDKSPVWEIARRVIGHPIGPSVIEDDAYGRSGAGSDMALGSTTMAAG